MEDALLEMIPNVQREEKDTLTYTLHRAQNDPACFMYYEQYSNKEAHSHHGMTEYFKTLVGKLDGKLDGGVEETFYEILGELDRS